MDFASLHNCVTIKVTFNERRDPMQNITTKKYRNLILAIILILSFLFSSSIGFAQEIQIKDLDLSSDYARLHIVDLFSQGIITGDENGYFHPIKPISRIEMLTLVVRMLNLDTSNLPEEATFDDIPKNHWAFPYVEAARQEGIVKGLTENYFGANQTCTREEMTTMFVRSLGFSDEDISNAFDMSKVNELSDKDEISNWAKEYVKFAMSTGIMNGTGDFTFSPKGDATREQAAVVTYRFLNEKENILSSIIEKDKITPDEIEKLRESIVLIQTYDNNKESLAQGSGFSIGEGLFLTSYHVLMGSDDYKIITLDGKEYDVEGIVKYNEDVDLAIIKTSELVNIEHLSVAPITMPQANQEIVVISNPNGQKSVISTGIFKQLMKIEYGESSVMDFIETTAQISSGSSGGALLDMRGNVIGVASATSNDGSLSYSVSTVHALDWIEELKSMDFEEIPVLDMREEIEKYYDTSDQGIKDVIIRAISSLENEDIETYMSTVHSFSPGYKEARPLQEELFKIYDLDYEITEINIIEKSYEEASVEAIYTVKTISGPSPINLTLFGEYFLAKEYGEWKILYAQETSVNE